MAGEFKSGRRGRYLGLAALAGVVYLIVMVFFWNSVPEDPPLADLIPHQVTSGGFVSSTTCRRCHEDAHASWRATYHRTMTQLASPQSVVAPFDDVRLRAYGREYHLQRRGDEFWARMPDPLFEEQLRKAADGPGGEASLPPDVPMVERRVLLTTGSHHMQTYWVSGNQGREVRHLPWYYHIAEKRWIPSKDSFLVPPELPQTLEQWNNTCIDCHAVAGNPGLDPQTGVMHSKVAEFGIACEACHGPGAGHVAYHEDPAKFTGQADPIVNPLLLSPRRASEICGSCHSARRPKNGREYAFQGTAYRAGRDLAEFFHVVRFGDQSDRESPEMSGFWGDGACRVGGDEFQGLLESKCFQTDDRTRQLSCLSCHSMHDSDPNDQLIRGREGNEACLQCHNDYRDSLEKHTHHAAGSSGSLCYNCHMPHTAYALFKAIRSHRVDSPSIASSVATGRPNACNLCHLDKTLDWSAKHLTDWHGAEPVTLNEEQQNTAASAIWLLRGNAAQRAVTAWHLGWPKAQEASGRNWSAPLVAQSLGDPYSAVRLVGYKSLRTLPGFAEFKYDFVAPAENRAAAIERALRIWRSQPRNVAKPYPKAVFLRPDGSFDQDAADRLLRQRDNTPVAILE